MVQCCSVPKCKSRHRIGNNISWHKLPKDPKRSKQWQLILQDWHEQNGSKYTFRPSIAFCSKHFIPAAYKNTGRLHFNAVPSIFHPQRDDEVVQIADSDYATSTDISEAETLHSQAMADISTITQQSAKSRNTEVSHAESPQKPEDSPNAMEETALQNDENTSLDTFDYLPSSPSISTVSSESGAELDTSQSRNRKLYLKELTPQDFSTPHMARLNLRLVKQEVFRAERRAKTYWEKMNATKNRVKHLQYILSDLSDSTKWEKDTTPEHDDGLQVLGKLCVSVIRDFNVLVDD